MCGSVGQVLVNMTAGFRSNVDEARARANMYRAESFRNLTGNVLGTSAGSMDHQPKRMQSQHSLLMQQSRKSLRGVSREGVPKATQGATTMIGSSGNIVQMKKMDSLHRLNLKQV